MLLRARRHVRCPAAGGCVQASAMLLCPLPSAPPRYLLARPAAHHLARARDLEALGRGLVGGRPRAGGCQRGEKGGGVHRGRRPWGSAPHSAAAAAPAGTSTAAVMALLLRSPALLLWAGNQRVPAAATPPPPTYPPTPNPRLTLFVLSLASTVSASTAATCARKQAAASSSSRSARVLGKTW